MRWRPAFYACSMEMAVPPFRRFSPRSRSTSRSCATRSVNASSATIAPPCSRLSSKVQRVMVPHTAHHERTTSALASLHKELDAALDLMIETVKTYYWIVADGYLAVGREVLGVSAVGLRVRLGEAGVGVEDKSAVPTGLRTSNDANPPFRFAPRWAKFGSRPRPRAVRKTSARRKRGRGLGACATSARR